MQWYNCPNFRNNNNYKSHNIENKKNSKSYIIYFDDDDIEPCDLFCFRAFCSAMNNGFGNSS